MNENTASPAAGYRYEAGNGSALRPRREPVPVMALWWCYLGTANIMRGIKGGRKVGKKIRAMSKVLESWGLNQTL